MFAGAAHATVRISISPTSATVPTGGKQQFTASVGGTTNTGVTWYVDNINGGNSSVGTVSSSGLYTAPAATGSHTVKAVSNANTTKAASASVTVAGPVSVGISPTSASLAMGGTQQFTATVTNSSNKGVTWSVDRLNGGSSSTGTISSSGLYTAPATPGTHTVTATSQADSTKSANATVNVSTTLSIDFGGRSNSTVPIAPGMIAGQLGYLANSVGLSLLHQANYQEFRIDAGLQNIYGTPTPDWTKLDPNVTLLQSNGFRPLIVIDYTPSWLQGTNYCPSGTSSVHNVPNDVNKWGQLAAAVVAHMDQAFPGLVLDYEIWNEPDLSSGLCTSGNTNTSRLNAYISMYAAAASQMKAQAAADGVQIRVGGPSVVGLGVTSTWLPAMLSNSGTAPYVDFISYHHYLAGQSDIQNGMGWDNTSGPASLYSRVQNTGSGAAAWFSYISSLVRQGSQPNPTKTPIYLTEYNDDWAFMNNCCRNSYAYSPLFNSLYVADTMNTVFSGAQNPPGMLFYFSASTPSGAFCLVGNIDANMDCAGNGTLPFAGYPQYYTYKLLAASNYLNLNGGGFMPVSLNAQSPLVMTGFYTVTGDAVLLINPTANTYSNLALTVNNPGAVSLNGTMFTLNSTNTQIASQAVSFTAAGNSATGTVSVPPYTVLGILLPTGVSAGGVSVKVTPSSATLVPNQQQNFTATVTGASNTAVNWFVDGIAGGNSTVGTINGGLYTAPATAGNHSVKATSVADPTQSASAYVVVSSTPPVSVTVTPSSATLLPGQQQNFVATVTNASNTAVTWYVDGTAGGTSAAGTITTSGLYTAPQSSGSHVVMAISAQDSTRNGSANVTVAAAAGVTADFGSRSGTSFPVPAGLFGAQLGTYQDQTELSMVAQGSFANARIDASFQTVFATSSTPNWTATDTLLTNLQAAGLHPIVTIDYTPSWLQPSPNPCAAISGSYYHAPPTDMTQWGNLAAAFVAHADQKFPGLVTQYEIWNEPDSPGGLCVSDNTDATRRTTYNAMFAAAAAAMHAQAALDGVTIQVGGPALGSPQGNAINWVPALLADANAAPQVDWVTYHQYLGTASSVSAGMNWDSSTATPPLFTRTQDPSTGAAALYKSIAGMVKKGTQPNAASTPIGITSFNATNAWALECCRNNATYAPLFNSLYVADVLNTVYSGAAAVPSDLVYYSMSTPAGYFCLVGNVDANMDCAYTSGTAVPYPQYYAYQLIGGVNFLGLGSGGHMANSLSPTTLTGGLVATAFYTGSNDGMVLVNPTASDVTNVTVNLQNLGYGNPTATLYLLNSANGQISSQPLALNLVGNGVTASITVPAYSTVGISVKGQ